MRTPFIVASLSLLALAACSPARTTPIETTDSLTLSWDLANERTDEFGQTSHDVSFVVSDASGAETARAELGSYDGCGVQAVPEDGPLLTLSCWFAGSGDEFQVRMQGTNTLVIDHRAVDAEAEIPLFSPIDSIVIPEGVLLLPVAAQAE